MFLLLGLQYKFVCLLMGLYYRKFCLNAREAKRVYIQAKLMLIQTVMPQFIVELCLANGLQTS